jgi:hypothetical protein
LKPKTNFGDKQNTAGFKEHPENIGGGRPEGVKNRSTILKKWIEIAAKVKHPENNEDIEGTMEDKINLALLTKALSGDVQAIKEINDTLYGKIPLLNELTGKDGKDLNTLIQIEIIDSAEQVKKDDSGSE